MYCKECGKEIKKEEGYCIECGKGDNDLNLNEEENAFCWSGLGFCVPIVGIILFAIWRKEKPKSSKYSLIGVITNFIFSMIAVTIIVTGVCFYLNYSLSKLVDTEENIYLIYETNEMSRFMELEHKKNNVVQYYEKNFIDFELLGLESENDAKIFIDNYENGISHILEGGIINKNFISSSVISENVEIDFENVGIDTINQWFGFNMSEYDSLEYLLNHLIEQGMKIVDEEEYNLKLIPMLLL